MSEKLSRPLRVLVVGASGGSGREIVKTLLARGHEVVALARNPRTLTPSERLTLFEGDALRATDLERAVEGCDAVVVTLGIRENPLAVRLGIHRTPIDVRSRGTTNIVAVMRQAGVRRLVVQTTYGIGESKGRLSFGWAFTFWLMLAPQIRDHERQETVVRDSGLDWTLVQPVGLVEADTRQPVFASISGQTRSMRVTRAQLAQVLADAVEGSFIRDTVAVSS